MKTQTYFVDKIVILWFYSSQSPVLWMKFGIYVGISKLLQNSFLRNLSCCYGYLFYFFVRF